MERIFSKEHSVVQTAENLLASGEFDSEADEEKYRALYEQYKKLLLQSTKVVRLADRVQLELKTVTNELEKASQVDMLTGLNNRMYFMKKCHDEWKSAVRNGGKLTLIMFDVDFFKEYNDTYGHLKGDKCLQAVARQISEEASCSHNVVGRYGGDEFVLLLPEAGMDEAAAAAQNILDGLNLLNLVHEGSEPFGKVTLSIGASVLTPDEDTQPEALFYQADQALYKAKRAGRNCFSFFDAEDVL